MEVVDRENVKIPCSVIISGLTDTESDEEVTDFLNKYGRIFRHIRIDDPKSPYHRHVIVEYESGAALEALEFLLPYSFTPSSGVTYQIRALSAEYVPTVTGSTTQSFLAELGKIAKRSGQSMEEILRAHLTECSKSVAACVDTVSEPEAESPELGLPKLGIQSEERPMSKVQSHATGHTSFGSAKDFRDLPQSATESNVFSPERDNAASVHYFNPPAVQRMIVEHVVRNEAPVSMMSASLRLRSFSGKIPCPSHEVDFDTWRNSVELILKDPALSDLQRSRRILDSLVPPAASIVKSLGPHAIPTAYLELLDSAFGIVEDGDELFAMFLSTFQDPGEKPSQYLHRLQTVLAKVLKRGGASASEADLHLLRQFCRGCWDNGLIADLQLERKRNHPPPFTELLLQLRVEEDKQSAKESRMKRHLGVTKQKAKSCVLAESSLESDRSLEHDVTQMKEQVTKLQSQFAQLKTEKSEVNKSSPNNVIAELKKQITELQDQLASMKAQKSHDTRACTAKVKVKQATKNKTFKCSPLSDQQPSTRPRAWYCFQCGIDGHIASKCPNEPNPSLVAEKKAKLWEKQSMWDSQHDLSTSHPLN